MDFLELIACLLEKREAIITIIVGIILFWYLFGVITAQQAFMKILSLRVPTTEQAVLVTAGILLIVGFIKAIKRYF